MDWPRLRSDKVNGLRWNAVADASKQLTLLIASVWRLLS